MGQNLWRKPLYFLFRDKLNMIINYYYRKNNIITDKLSKKLNLLDNNHKYINKNKFIITPNHWLIENVTKYKSG